MSGPGGLSGIVLAAGLSRRAAPLNKLLIEAAGRPAVRAVVEAFCAAGLGEVVVVTGHEHTRIEAALSGLPVRFVVAEDYRLGMGRSLAEGVHSSRAEATGFLISPADLPRLRAEHVRAVAERFCATDGECHVIPTAAGRRGHPVALGAWLRPALKTLAGDQGARVLLAAEPERSHCDFLELNDLSICADNDFGAPS